MLFTDTDSLTYEITSEDVYEEFFKNKHLFDFSNYPKDSIVYKGVLINKLVGLKSKIHLMLSDDGKESNTAKGLNTATEFNEFKDTLFTKKFSDTKWKEFKAKNINLEQAKSTTNHYSVLMIKDLF